MTLLIEATKLVKSFSVKPLSTIGESLLQEAKLGQFHQVFNGPRTNGGSIT